MQSGLLPFQPFVEVFKLACIDTVGACHQTRDAFARECLKVFSLLIDIVLLFVAFAPTARLLVLAF